METHPASYSEDLTVTSVRLVSVTLELLRELASLADGSCLSCFSSAAATDHKELSCPSVLYGITFLFPPEISQLEMSCFVFWRQIVENQKSLKITLGLG